MRITLPIALAACRDPLPVQVAPPFPPLEAGLGPEVLVAGPVTTHTQIPYPDEVLVGPSGGLVVYELDGVCTGVLVAPDATLGPSFASGCGPDVSYHVAGDGFLVATYEDGVWSGATRIAPDGSATEWTLGTERPGVGFVELAVRDGAETRVFGIYVDVFQQETELVRVDLFDDGTVARTELAVLGPQSATPWLVTHDGNTGAVFRGPSGGGLGWAPLDEDGVPIGAIREVPEFTEGFVQRFLPVSGGFVGTMAAVDGTWWRLEVDPSALVIGPPFSLGGLPGIVGEAFATYTPIPYDGGPALLGTDDGGAFVLPIGGDLPGDVIRPDLPPVPLQIAGGGAGILQVGRGPASELFVAAPGTPTALFASRVTSPLRILSLRAASGPPGTWLGWMERGPYSYTSYAAASAGPFALWLDPRGEPLGLPFPLALSESVAPVLMTESEVWLMQYSTTPGLVALDRSGNIRAIGALPFGRGAWLGDRGVMYRYPTGFVALDADGGELASVALEPEVEWVGIDVIADGPGETALVVTTGFLATGARTTLWTLDLDLEASERTWLDGSTVVDGWGCGASCWQLLNDRDAVFEVTADGGALEVEVGPGGVRAGAGGEDGQVLVAVDATTATLTGWNGLGSEEVSLGSWSLAEDQTQVVVVAPGTGPMQVIANGGTEDGAGAGVYRREVSWR